MEYQQEAQELRLQLTTLQGQHKETVEQLTEKSKHLLSAKTDMDHTSQQNHAMAEEVRARILGLGIGGWGAGDDRVSLPFGYHRSG